MTEPTVALVFSPEQWVEELHRYLAHHGGARVRQIVVDPAVALDEEFDALVVSDRWPALTLGFVGAIHERGRRVLGVFDPEEPAGKDHLLALGVDSTIAGDAPMAKFVAALADLDVAAPFPTNRAPVSGAGPGGTPAGSLVVVSGPRGSGITEVAVALATASGARPRRTVLVDAHESAPAVAGRLGLGLEPNLRSAVDACAHGLGVLGSAIVPAGRGSASLDVVAGFPSPVAAAQVTTRDVLDVLRWLRSVRELVVVDADSSGSTTDALLDEVTAVVTVVGASPVGVVRAMEWLAHVHRRTPTTPLHVAVNRAPVSQYRREEIRAEIVRMLPPASITWLPSDRSVEAAAWNGEPVVRGPFQRAVEHLARAVCPEPTPRRRWRSR